MKPLPLSASLLLKNVLTLPHRMRSPLLQAVVVFAPVNSINIIDEIIQHNT
jgi:hypothetical protein